MRIKVKLISSAKQFGAPLAELFRIIQSIREVDGETKLITIDLSACRFSNPFLLGGLAVVQRIYTNKGMQIEFDCNCQNEAFRTYLNLIHFPTCIDPLTFNDEDYNGFIQTYTARNYIPITIYPNSHNLVDSARRDRFISEIEQLIINRCRLNNNISQAVRYLMSEALDNVLEHSHSNFSVLFMQYYPSFKHLDLIIADSGIGLWGSYKARMDRFPNIGSHADAMKKAMNGNSTKDGPETRGYGISTSRNMLVHGLNGIYLLMSGDAIFVHDQAGNARIVSATNNPFDGVLLALRIPVDSKDDFNYINYLE